MGHRQPHIFSCILPAVMSRLVISSGSRCLRGVAGIVFAALPVAALNCSPLHAASLPSTTPQATFVVFADHSMQQVEWSEIVAAVRTGLAQGGAETVALDPNPRFLRADEAGPGFQADSAIPVYLHGNCNVEPMERRTAFEVPLGWVRRIDGQIESAVHVDCTRIGQVIGAQVRWLSRQGRDHAMAGAVARVILHEWIHIATQSAAHSEQGIEKAGFDVPDLVNSSTRAAWRGR